MAGIPDSLKGRSYTTVGAWTRDELQTALDLADELKQERARRKELRILPGRTVGLIFRKPSTRTRISSEVGIAELGGMALYVPAADLQLSRGESTRDTALVLSRFLSALMIRTFAQAEVDEFAEHATIPVINGLTDEAHPLQALADAMTIRERFGTLAGLRIAYLGRRQQRLPLADAHRRAGSAWSSWRRRRRDTRRASVSPRPRARTRRRTAAASRSPAIPREAAAGAHVLYTDVWTSMGQDEERERRLRDLDAYRIDGALLGLADREGIVLHCLPAHVGEEIAGDVLYGPRSLVWDQAENRLHTQKAIMALVIR